MKLVVRKRRNSNNTWRYRYFEGSDEVTIRELTNSKEKLQLKYSANITEKDIEAIHEKWGDRIVTEQEVKTVKKRDLFVEL